MRLRMLVCGHYGDSLTQHDYAIVRLSIVNIITDHHYNNAKPHTFIRSYNQRDCTKGQLMVGFMAHTHSQKLVCKWDGICHQVLSLQNLDSANLKQTQLSEGRTGHSLVSNPTQLLPAGSAKLCITCEQQPCILKTTLRSSRHSTRLSV